MKGTVKWFTKGFGFIAPDEDHHDVFVHHSEILGHGYRTLEQGDRVSFNVVHGDRGPRAAGVIIIEPAKPGTRNPEREKDSRRPALPRGEDQLKRFHD